MENITENFGTLYKPVKALMIYRPEGRSTDSYVEAFDMDAEGFMVNAHPLSVQESKGLSKALDVSAALKRGYLKSKGLMPKNVLYINADQDGFALWHTPAMEADLFFVEDLGIPDGRAKVPPLLWKADRHALRVYALNTKEEIDPETVLYHAPFFNMYADGRVCMGTVRRKFAEDCSLEEFMEQWQQYFFNSYFSHHIGSHNPVRGNLSALWAKLIGTGNPFPVKALQKTKFTLKNLLK